jgi:hypothetical protein
MADSYLLIDYVYLDSEERKRFAQASHEYLIEQLQFTGSESLTAASNKYRLNFNHPCKYLVWVPHLERHATRQSWVCHSQDADWALARDRFAKVLYLASRNVTALNMPVTGLAGDVIEPAAAAAVAGNAALTALLAKVECKYVNQTGGANDGLTAGSLDNVVVVRNNLTMEDISMTVAQLNAQAGVSANVTALFAISAVNHFNYGNFVDGSDNPCVNAKLQLNGHDRFQARDGSYFNYVQPAQHWSNTPADGVNVYSFALKAEDHQPTGTCNFSRIDNATLQVDVGKNNASDSTYVATYVGSNSNSVVNIYTQNYNVLRVMSGMAGTAYSN